MIYCSLDQALVLSGWSIFNNNELIEWGIFKTKNSSPIEERLGQFWKKLNELYNKYNFDHLFFEDCQKQTNLETYRKLCYVQATVLLWCYYNNIKYTILSPSHWRKILTDKYKVKFGKSRPEQKKAAQQLILEVCGHTLTEDEADAICINLAGQIEYNKNRSAF